MEKRYFSNNATTTVTTDSGTTLVVASTANFPSSYPFYVTLENGSLVREIVKVTSLATTNTWNVIRAQEGTVQTSFISGNKCELRITAGTLNSLVTDKAELSGAVFTGAISVKSASGNGSVSMNNGNTSHSGFTSFFAPDGTTRTGYMGWADTTDLYIVTENDRQLSFHINGYTNAFQMMYSTALPKLAIDGKDVPRRYPAGSALPTIDIGPIWHDDYNDWMTWQVFNANGANYTGYASINIGRIVADNQRYRTGYMMSGVSAASKTTYAALWNWAIHVGLTVAIASWSIGQIQFADNGNGTFRIPDIRGVFTRWYHDGFGGFDPEYTSRTFQSFQQDTFRNHTHASAMNSGGKFWVDGSGFGSVQPGFSITGTNTTNSYVATGATGGLETRPSNINQFATLKF